MSKAVIISPLKVELEELYIFFKKEFQIKLSEDSERAIDKSRSYLETTLEETDELIYGVNTGFGSLCNVEINKSQIAELQENLVLSHAAGAGDTVPEEISRLVLLLKIKSLAFGYSGVRRALVEKLIELYNKKVTPVIYQQGSLGASGDLAPLAHLGLVLLGKGKVWYESEQYNTSEILQKLEIESLSLKAKEGLAIINGTQFSLAYSVWCSYHASRIIEWADIIASLSLEAYQSSLSPFDPDLQLIRQHKGQQRTASRILHWLDDSDIIKNAEHKNVQDPYSFRCIPQVHGASYDALHHVFSVVHNEVNAVTDNPNIFEEEEKVISGGNFHAQPLALALDYMGIALSEFASISERRVFKLLSGERGLPDYLTNQSGLNSGLMIAQYTAASIVSQNKQLCTPCSVDSITSCKGQEDHVSMAANAATKTLRIVENVYTVLAIELMTAVQALEFRKPYKPAINLQEVVDDYRQVVDRLDQDRVISEDISKTLSFIKERCYSGPNELEPPFTGEN